MTSGSYFTSGSGTSKETGSAGTAGKASEGVVIAGNVQTASAAESNGTALSKAVAAEVSAQKGNVACKRYDGTVLDQGAVNGFGEIVDVVIPIAALDETKQILCEVSLNDGQEFLTHCDLSGKVAGERIQAAIDAITTLAAKEVLLHCDVSTHFENLSFCGPKIKEGTVKPKDLFEEFKKKFTEEAATPLPEPQIDWNGLVLYYPFNGNAKDESGNGNDGTINGAVLAPDRLGKENSAYRFRGGDDFVANGDYLETQPSASLDIQNAITLAAWVKHDKQAQGGQIINGPGGKYRLSAWWGNPHGYAFELYDGPPPAPPDLLAGLYSNQHIVHEHMGSIANEALIPPLDQWIHVTATWDGQKMKIYRNCDGMGVEDFVGTLPSVNQSIIDMGVLSVLKDRQWFAGSIDEVFIFNRALSEFEIKGICAGIAPFITVTIEIKPTEEPNPINPKSQGNIPVAIFSTATFDVTEALDQSSFTFGRTGDEQSLLRCNPEDVNKDGYADWVCHFDNQTAAFQLGDTEGILKGKTKAGLPIRGSDSVKIVP